MAGQQVVGAGVSDGSVIAPPSFREINTSRGPGRVYDIAFSDGKTYGTFDVDLANRAAALVGQPCSIQWEQTRKGQYDNWNLKGIGQQGSFGPASQGGYAAPVAQVQALQPAAPAAAIQPASGGNGRSVDPEREERIIRGNASNAAGAIVGHLFAVGTEPEVVWGTFHRFAVAIANFIRFGEGPGGVVATPQSGPEIAAVVNAEAGAAVVQVGAPVVSDSAQNRSGIRF